jgi:hypothetical protein
MIVGIEFDVLSGYKTLEDCQKWLQSSAYSFLTNFKFFHLRKKKQGMWMSHEKRPVISWLGEIWKNKSLRLTRPEVGIVVVEAGPGENGVFSAKDFPPLQAITEEKLAEKLIRDKTRKEAREKKRLEAKAKKQSGKEKRKREGLSKPKLEKKQKNSPVSTDQAEVQSDQPLGKNEPFLPDVINLPPSPFDGTELFP